MLSFTIFDDESIHILPRYPRNGSQPNLREDHIASPRLAENEDQYADLSHRRSATRMHRRSPGCLPVCSFLGLRGLHSRPPIDLVRPFDAKQNDGMEG
jgi:hypothetical protein